jgi:hypothetical protein
MLLLVQRITDQPSAMPAYTARFGAGDGLEIKLFSP